jgi:hypothetical protein
MALTLDDLLDGLRASRLFFYKHISGLTDEQWSWKPYPECKSVTRTIVHLVANDRAALQSLATNAEPEYEQISEAATVEAAGDRDRALAMLQQSHDQLCAAIAARFGSAPMDAEMCAWGSVKKLPVAVGYLSSEDFYHAGQVAFIRLATDPSWDYLGQIYGTE